MKARPEKRHQFGAGLMLIVFTAFTVFQISGTIGVANPVARKGAIFDIIPDAPTLSSSAATGSTFFITGKIYPFRTVNQADCSVPSDLDKRLLGTWRAWGTVGDGGKLVLHQTLLLELFNSTIEVQGTTGQKAGDASAVIPGTVAPTAGPPEVLAVVGGTGRYEGVNGAANINPYCNPTLGGTSPFRFDRAFCFGLE